MKILPLLFVALLPQTAVADNRLCPDPVNPCPTHCEKLKSAYQNAANMRDAGGAPQAAYNGIQAPGDNWSLPEKEAKEVINRVFFDKRFASLVIPASQLGDWAYQICTTGAYKPLWKRGEVYPMEPLK